MTIIVLKIDTLIYSQFRFHISPFVLEMVFGKNAGDIFHVDGSNIIKAILFISLIALIQICIFLLAKKLAIKNIKTTYILYTLLATLIFSNITFAWADAGFYRPITQAKEIYPLFFPLTAKSLLTKMNLVDKELIDKNQMLYKLDHKNAIKYPLTKLNYTEPKNKKNFLFLIVDSWKYTCLDSITTPNLYQISKKSQVFNNHHSGSNATDDGMFTLFYGVSGLCNDAFTNHEISPAFMSVLKEQNYRMKILGSATLENPPFNKNIFLNIPNLRLNSKGNTPSERDIDITKNWIIDYKNRNKDVPFFDFLFFDAAHGYDVPKNYPKVFSPALDVVDYTVLDNNYNPDKMLNLYKNSLHFIDSLSGKIIKTLKENNQLDNSVIVVTSDHGQEFNDNKKGFWNHGGNYTKHQTKVPFFIYDSKKKPQHYNHLTLHYDVTSTLMSSFLGVKNKPNDISIGKNLYDAEERDWFLCGYKNSYAIVEKNKITKITKNSGVFTITDERLNPLEKDSINYPFFEKAIGHINRFYIKK
jgi:membrane-anchored protein YejM (alkaline phosphatase superfamily)